MLCSPPCCVGQRGADVVVLEVWEVGEDVLVRLTSSEKANDGADGDPHASNTWLATHDIWGMSHTGEQVFHKVECIRVAWPVETAD